MTRDQRIRRAIAAAAQSLWPFSLEMMGLKAMLFNLLKPQNICNLRFLIGMTKHEFNKLPT